MWSGDPPSTKSPCRLSVADCGDLGDRETRNSPTAAGLCPGDVAAGRLCIHILYLAAQAKYTNKHQTAQWGEGRQLRNVVHGGFSATLASMSGSPSPCRSQRPKASASVLGWDLESAAKNT